MSNLEQPLNNNGPDNTYRSYLEKRIFALPKCSHCDEFHFFPRIVCPHCGEFDLEWHAVSGKGEVYSITTIRRKAERGGNYNVCLITLAEGPRMMSRIDGIEPEQVYIGDKVMASIINENDEHFIVFTPTIEA